jgi:hypothetical protein
MPRTHKHTWMHMRLSFDSQLQSNWPCCVVINSLHMLLSMQMQRGVSWPDSPLLWSRDRTV